MILIAEDAVSIKMPVHELLSYLIRRSDKKLGVSRDLVKGTFDFREIRKETFGAG
jgi:hypothetical protein